MFGDDRSDGMGLSAGAVRLAGKVAIARNFWYVRGGAFIALLSGCRVFVSVAAHVRPAAARAIEAAVVTVAVVGIHASNIIALLW